MRQICQLPVLLGMLLLISACVSQPEKETATSTQQPPPLFQHELSGIRVPWTHDDFDNNPDKFTFALFSDLTGGEREDVFEVALEQLRLLRPELVVSVGDLIEGETTDRGQLMGEWGSFDQRAELSLAPVFRVGGNHDLANPEMWAVWEERYGSRYYHFLYKDVLFLVLDTEDNPPDFQQYIHEIRQDMMRVVDEKGWEVFDETEYGQLEERKSGRIGVQQAAYFRNVIKQNPDVRWTFLLMHKPAWQRPDEENFSTVEEVLRERSYTVFYGHVHSYLYETRLGRDYIRLGTTGGVHIAGRPMSVDHVTLVTVSEEDPEIANLKMSGIFDRTGSIPLNGEELCLENCQEQ